MPITVYYATNRNETGTAAKPSFGPNFHAKGPHYLRFGSADVEPPTKPSGDYKVKSVYLAPESLPGAGSKAKKSVLGSREIFDELRKNMKADKSDLLLLIHGFACEFTAALERAAQLKQDYGTAGRPLEVAVFSWPADGEMIPEVSYYQDRDDAKASATAIARAFLKMLDYSALSARRSSAGSICIWSPIAWATTPCATRCKRSSGSIRAGRCRGCFRTSS